jgi:A/G-specific adenine glycosylase
VKRTEPGVALLSWYRALDRAMPWRGVADPYAVWISEIMLQQTTVKAVTPRFAAFLERFPDVATLAAAAEEEVLAAVAGLGYYRRFRSLHRAAREIVAAHAGKLPQSAAAWKGLPGIGDYTAAAIGSIAFGERVAAIDGNVIRVLTRFDARTGRHESAKRRRELAQRVEELMPLDEAAGDFTQALFDLGREVCTPRDPRCEACPWQSECKACARGETSRFPEVAARPKPTEQWVLQALLRRGNQVLVRRRSASASRMPEFWEFPEVWCDPGAAVAEVLAEHLGTPLLAAEERVSCRHAITRYRLDCRLIEVQAARAVATGEADRWVDIDRVEQEVEPLSTISRKLYRLLPREA